jgi:hypothetical protein
MAKLALIAIVSLASTIALNGASLAANCDDLAKVAASNPVTGETHDGITKRCVGISGAQGVSLTCDVSERAVSSFCNFISTATDVSTETFLLSAGRLTPRSAGCLWSGNVVANLIVFCKAIGPRRGDVKGGPWDGKQSLD